MLQALSDRCGHNTVCIVQERVSYILDTQIDLFYIVHSSNNKRCNYCHCLKIVG